MSQISLKVQADKWSLQGALTVDTVQEAFVACRKALQQAALKKGQTQTAQTVQKSLQIDFEQVTQYDSSALAFLIEIMRWHKAQKGTVKFLNLPQKVRDIAKVNGVDTFLSIVD